METYLKLFEEVVNKQAEFVGAEKARQQAKTAGLGISEDGRVVSAAGNPHIILLRLVKAFTSSGSMASLEACTPLINEFIRRASQDESLPQLDIKTDLN
jgi:hypothetical protein